MILKNGKRFFTQWDKGQVIIINEFPPGTQVHFSNKKSSLAYVLETNENYEVEVPDTLLQEPFPITAWLYQIEGSQQYTETRREFQVIRRPRPESYIYTDEERAYWETKVDKNWGANNAGKILIIGFDGNVIASDVSDSSLADKSLIYNQGIPSNEWTIVHNMNKYPSVTVVDSANTVITGEVTYLSQNSLRINFQAAFSGKAYLN